MKKKKKSSQNVLIFATIFYHLTKTNIFCKKEKKEKNE